MKTNLKKRVDSLIDKKRALHTAVYVDDKHTWAKDSYTSDAGEILFHLIQSRWELKNGFYFNWAASNYSKEECLKFDEEMMATNSELCTYLDQYKIELIDSYVNTPINHDGWLNTFKPDMSQAITKLNELRDLLSERGRSEVVRIVSQLKSGNDLAALDFFVNYATSGNGFGSDYKFLYEIPISLEERSKLKSEFLGMRMAYQYDQVAKMMASLLNEIECIRLHQFWGKVMRRIQQGFCSLEIVAIDYFQLCVTGSKTIDKDIAAIKNDSKISETWNQVLTKTLPLFDVYQVRRDAIRESWLYQLEYQTRNIGVKDADTGRVNIYEWLV